MAVLARPVEAAKLPPRVGQAVGARDHVRSERCYCCHPADWRGRHSAKQSCRPTGHPHRGGPRQPWRRVGRHVCAVPSTGMASHSPVEHVKTAPQGAVFMTDLSTKLASNPRHYCASSYQLDSIYQTDPVLTFRCSSGVIGATSIQRVGTISQCSRKRSRQLTAHRSGCRRRKCRPCGARVPGCATAIRPRT